MTSPLKYDTGEEGTRDVVRDTAAEGQPVGQRKTGKAIMYTDAALPKNRGGDVPLL